MFKYLNGNENYFIVIVIVIVKASYKIHSKMWFCIDGKIGVKLCQIGTYYALNDE